MAEPNFECPASGLNTQGPVCITMSSDEHHLDTSLIKPDIDLGSVQGTGELKTECLENTDLGYAHLHPDQLKTETVDLNDIKAEQNSHLQDFSPVETKSSEMKCEYNEILMSDQMNNLVNGNENDCKARVKTEPWSCEGQAEDPESSVHEAGAVVDEREEEGELATPPQAPPPVPAPLSASRGGGDAQTSTRTYNDEAPFLKIQQAGFDMLQRELAALRRSVNALNNQLRRIERRTYPLQRAVSQSLERLADAVERLSNPACLPARQDSPEENSSSGSTQPTTLSSWFSQGAPVTSLRLRATGQKRKKRRNMN